MALRRLAATVVSLALVFTVTACGSSASKAPSQTSGGSGSTPANATPQVLKVGWNDAITFDPPNDSDITGLSILFNSYERLVKYNAREAKIEPQLADNWKISDDGKVYTFHLNPKARFASGNPVTAEDVKYSFDRVLAYKEAVQGFLLTAYVQPGGVKAVDPSTVEITLKSPFGGFLAALASVTASVLDSKVVQQHVDAGDLARAWLSAHTAGSGPFEVKEWVKSSHITLARNANYWGTPAKLDQVIINVIPEASQQAVMLQKGDLDVALGLLPEQIEGLKGKVQVAGGSDVATYYLGMNMAEDPFKKLEVRKAVKYAIDYKGIIDGILHGYGVRAGGVIAKGLIGYDPSLDNVYDYNPDKARQLLKDAGYADGFQTKLYLSNLPIKGLGIPGENLATKIQSDLAKVGIKAELVSQDINPLFATYRTGKLPFLVWFWGPTFPDPDPIMSPHGDWQTQGTTRVGFNNPTVTDLITRARVESNPEKRAEMYKQAQQIVQDVGPYVFLFRTQNLVGVNNRVKNFDWNPFWTMDLREVSVG